MPDILLAEDRGAMSTLLDYLDTHTHELTPEAIDAALLLAYERGPSGLPSILTRLRLFRDRKWRSHMTAEEAATLEQFSQRAASTLKAFQGRDAVALTHLAARVYPWRTLDIDKGPTSPEAREAAEYLPTLIRKSGGGRFLVRTNTPESQAVWYEFSVWVQSRYAFPAPPGGAPTVEVDFPAPPPLPPFPTPPFETPQSLRLTRRSKGLRTEIEELRARVGALEEKVG